MTRHAWGPLPGEDAAVARIRRHFAADPAHVVLGPGHDCAVVDVDGARVVLTSDVLVDGVHFHLARSGAAAAGAKALLVNLSDLAAAGARPVGFEIGVVLPRDAEDLEGLLDGLARGLAAVSARHDCPCLGGDTNVAPGPLVLAVTVVGRPGTAGRILTRAGALVGDHLSVTGPLGGSGRGRHLTPRPRLAEGLLLAELSEVHAAMDLSDGLSRDLPRLCAVSGVGARVEAHAVPIHVHAREAAASGRSPLEHALDDGEDFELLVAHADLGETARRRLAHANVELVPIGRIEAAAHGIRLSLGTGSVPLAARGFDHLAPSEGDGMARACGQGKGRRFRSPDPRTTRALGRALACAARPLPPGGLVVSLTGELGTGKTVFVKGLAEGLDLPSADVVVSPTFTIARSYDTPSGTMLHHIDAYRLTGSEELELVGFEDLCGNGSLTCVEWGERVRDALPEDRLHVHLEVLGGEARPEAEPHPPRRVSIRAGGPVTERVLERMEPEGE